VSTPRIIEEITHIKKGSTSIAEEAVDAVP
jgi:hypothetical protein